MSRLTQRISKLEQRLPISDEFPIVFVTFGGPNEPSDPSLAIAPSVGDIHRRSDETTAEFKRRAYALKAAGMPLEELTEAEFAAAYTKSNQLLAESKLETKTEAEQNGRI